ncbi:hypothetical protein GCM10025738_14930 [Microbacterium fluvii]
MHSRQPAENTASANTAIRQAFDVDMIQADAILSMSVRRFTPDAIQQMHVELSDVEAALAP